MRLLTKRVLNIEWHRVFRFRSRASWFFLLLAGGAVLLPVTGLFAAFWTEAIHRPVTFVVMGSDSRQGDGPSRSDAIFVLRADPMAGVIRGLSIPRDLYVPIQGIPLLKKEDRINTALFWGDYYGGRQGMNAACRTIGELTHLSINGSVILRFNLVRKLVDALDGVEVYLDKPAYDPSFLSLTGGPHQPLRFESGWNYLDGDRALDFIRLRKPDMDFGRMKRNRQLSNSLLRRLRDGSCLPALIGAFPSLLREVDTNLGWMDRVRIGWACYTLRHRDIQWDAVQRYDVSSAVTPRGAQVLVPNEGALRQAGRRLMGEPRAFARAP